MLFRWIEPESGRAVWFTPGGGLHSGETHLDAPKRELREEVGIDVGQVGPCVWTRRHILPRNRKTSLDLRDGFYVVEVEDTAVDTSGFTSADVESITESRWMTPDEIAALPDVVAPKRLAAFSRQYSEASIRTNRSTQESDRMLHSAPRWARQSLSAGSDIPSSGEADLCPAFRQGESVLDDRWLNAQLV